MNTGHHKIAFQRGEVGYFCEVSLSIERQDRGGIVVYFDDSEARRWEVAVKFGCQYVWEHLLRQSDDCKGMHVHVTGLRWYEVDTTSVIVAFATVLAFLAALKTSLKCSISISEDGEFVFPK